MAVQRTKFDAPEDLDTFGATANKRIRATQAAWLELLGEIDLSGARPTAIARRLGLDKTLAWKVAKFAGEEDSGKAFRHLPGESGVEIVLKAIRDRGVVESRIEPVRVAVTQLRSFVREQAGDRRAFEAMVSGNHRESKTELEHRRQLYRANSAIWGVRAASQILTVVLRPSASVPGMLDVVQLGGLVGLERLRVEVPWIVRRLRASNDNESKRYQIPRRPLDASVGPDDQPLLKRYCTKPLPELRQFEDENGWIYDELVAGPVGRSGSVTCVLGEHQTGVLPARYDSNNTAGRYSLTVRTPVEHVLFDLLIHRDLEQFGEAEMRTYGLLEGRPTAGGGTQNASPLYEPRPARRLGSPAIVQSARLNWYAAMVRDSLEWASWGGLDDFRGYRMESEYPPIPCDLTMVCAISPENH